MAPVLIVIDEAHSVSPAEPPDQLAALAADHVIFASGYRADLARVPYLAGVADQMSITDGFPDLSEGFETSLDGLYMTGFASTRDFGPFYGFTAGCTSSARIAVAEIMR